VGHTHKKSLNITLTKLALGEASLEDEGRIRALTCINGSRMVENKI